MMPEPARPEGQSHVVGLRCPPLETVRIAVIGVGNRGQGAVKRLVNVPHAELTVLVDVVEEKITRALEIFTEQGGESVDTLVGPEAWREVLDREDVDLVYICAHWDLHAPISVEAMEHGKHVAVELPAALTLEEAWELVDTAERTRRHCMMLENTNYDFFEMTTLHMAQQGLFGELVHAEGAYIHELRSMMFSDSYYWDHWRLKQNQALKGNLYPTHGLGPVAHALNIHRGDRMTHLTCMETDQFCLTAYAREKYGEDSPQARQEYRQGDMSTALIRTEQGKTIVIQHDVASPRPYSRIHLLSGTKGIARKYPSEAIAFGHDEGWLKEEELKELLEQHQHPISRTIGEKAKEVGGHGGMDFIMDSRLVHCLHHGLPLDQNVYDAAAWSALVELTRYSVENCSVPVAFPDFTRGAWQEEKATWYYDPDMNGTVDASEPSFVSDSTVPAFSGS
jgi:predicted dehydrogenase